MGANDANPTRKRGSAYRITVGAAALACASGWYLLTIAGCAPSNAAPAAGKAAAAEQSDAVTAPWNGRLVDVDGRHLLGEQGEETKAIALVFILPDCPIGNSYMPELNRLYEAFASRGVVMAVVYADPETTSDAAKQHASEFQLRWPVVLDRQHEWVQRAGAKIAPEAAVFSPTGELLYRGRIDNQYAGLGKRRMNVTSRELADALEAILAGLRVPEARTEAVGCYIPELPKRD